MSYGEIDRFPVNQLEDRYGIVRSAVYTRLNALGIKPDKVGNKAYINAKQLRAMDDLHEFIQAGGNTAEFLERQGRGRVEEEPPEQSSGLSNIQSDPMQLMGMMAEMMARLQPNTPPPNPFAYFEFLEQAARNGWLLRTSEVAELLRLAASEIQSYGDSFSEAGFLFTRAGYRSQGETAWRVSKAGR